MQLEILERLRKKGDFYNIGPDWVRSVWKTQAAFEWFCKSRREVLERRGGLRRMGRDWFIDSELFAQAVACEFDRVQSDLEGATL